MKGFAMDERNPLIIMAAGKGSRMKASADVPEWVLEEAASRPKAMIRIGQNRKPLLQHLVERAKEEGLRDICIVVGEHDEITRPHFDALRLDGIDLSFVVQTIPAGRTKPAGTAQAVQLALEAHPDWDGASVTVANGDNLPPFGMFQAMLAYRACLPAFDRDHLGLPAGRVQAFAVISHNDQGGLARIDEKPDEATIQSAIWLDGTVRVSMNYFRVPYCDLLEAVRTVPEHPKRKEKELPVALSNWSEGHPGDLQVLPMAGAFLDLTHPQDIVKAGELLDQGGFELRI
ncbi:MAG: sugar phosphate nucleotidyltransferase [Bacteroidota bacterium]|nr:sugar phosphate nucleotidyltransferase [Bacteroidota bacterium]